MTPEQRKRLEFLKARALTDASTADKRAVRKNTKDFDRSFYNLRAKVCREDAQAIEAALAALAPPTGEGQAPIEAS